MNRDDWLALGPDGWQPLLAELDAALRERWPGYTIAQVKEKFGTLRFYADHNLEIPDFPDDEAGDAARERWHAGNTAPFYALIREYEVKSASICELCGAPGKLGAVGYWRSTRCTGCAPDGWVADDVECDHESITDGTCDDCGRTRLARLEHTGDLLTNTHPYGSCAGEYCTIHHRSDHVMRAFPQQWRSDRMVMERVCPHGVGHPDPDDISLAGPDAAAYAVHGCDGCCAGAGLDDPADLPDETSSVEAPGEGPRRAHLGGCPCENGSCCPWMGDCTCQCMCDLIAQVEDRVRAEYDPSENDAAEGYRKGYATAAAECESGHGDTAAFLAGYRQALADVATRVRARQTADTAAVIELVEELDREQA